MYYRLLSHLVDMLYADVEKYVLDKYLPVRTDSWADYERAIAAVKLSLNETRRAVLPRVKDVGRRVAAFNKKEWSKIVRAGLGVDVFKQEPWLLDELKAFDIEVDELVESFSAQALSRIEKIVLKGVRDGSTLTQISAMVRERVPMTKRKALLAARAHVAAFNGKLTELRQEAAGVTEYRWRNSNDERVRGNPAGKYPKAAHSHWNKEGRKYSWKKPPKDTGHPGEEYLCRCYAEPVFDPLLD